jgi:hypothetical protein
MNIKNAEVRYACSPLTLLQGVYTDKITFLNFTGVKDVNTILFHGKGVRETQHVPSARKVLSFFYHTNVGKTG